MFSVTTFVMLPFRTVRWPPTYADFSLPERIFSPFRGGSRGGLLFLSTARPVSSCGHPSVAN